jgi:hypothetical protein
MRKDIQGTARNSNNGDGFGSIDSLVQKVLAKYGMPSDDDRALSMGDVDPEIATLCLGLMFKRRTES